MGELPRSSEHLLETFPPWITRKDTESQSIFCSLPADTGTVDNVSRGAPQHGPKASLTPKPRVSACALQYLAAEQL